MGGPAFGPRSQNKPPPWSVAPIVILPTARPASRQHDDDRAARQRPDHPLTCVSCKEMVELEMNWSDGLCGGVIDRSNRPTQACMHNLSRSSEAFRLIACLRRFSSGAGGRRSQTEPSRPRQTTSVARRTMPMKRAFDLVSDAWRMHGPTPCSTLFSFDRPAPFTATREQAGRQAHRSRRDHRSIHVGGLLCCCRLR